MSPFGFGPGGHGRGGRLRGLVLPSLLLAIAKQPAHGYELMEAMAGEEWPDVDPGTLYRTLRLLEEEGLVTSSWQTAEAGPARRVYQVTDEGIEYLHTLAVGLRKQRARLDRFLSEYEERFAAGR